MIHISAQARVLVFKTPGIARIDSTTSLAISTMLSASNLTIKSWSQKRRFASVTKDNEEAASNTFTSEPGSTFTST